ncbi:MAG: hypothetical protein J5874_04010 [Oscillospiraceae bacterium]|nr:hypothetical protein [Oscillospiraceae bacterium]
MESNPVFVGQYVYYLAGADNPIYLCRFDLKSGKFEKLYETKGGTLSEMNVCGDSAYFNQSELNEKGNVEFTLLKLDIKSRSVNTLTTEPQSVPQFLLSAEDGKLFWYTDAGEHYSTDADYNNRIDGDVGYSEKLSSKNYTFTVEPTGQIKGAEGSKLPAYRVRRKDKTTGEILTVIDEICSFPLIYDDSILYFKFQDTVPFLGYVYDENTDDCIAVTDKNGGKLYICDLNGENERLLCDITDSGCTFTYTVGVAGKSGTGDFIGIELNTYEENGEYIKQGKNALLVVNIKTGDSKIVRVD